MFFYFYQVLSVVWWLETLNTLGYVLALEKVSYQLKSPTYLFRGLSSALRTSNVSVFENLCFVITSRCHMQLQYM